MISKNLKLTTTLVNLNFVRYVRQIKSVPLINVSQKYDVKHIPKELFNDYYNYPMEIDPLGTRMPGFWFKKEFKYIKEMEPELMVPDLEDFDLKPYVSYKTKDIENNEFTAKNLFQEVYAKDLIDKAMKDENFNLEVNNEEVLEAKLKALRPNSDLFEPDLDELNKFDEM